MNRNTTNYYIDLIITILFLIVAFTGFYIYLFIPEGISQGRYQVYMGLTKATWTFIHNKASILLTLFVGIHLLLHWKWINCTTLHILKLNKKNNLNCTVDQEEGYKINK